MKTLLFFIMLLNSGAIFAIDIIAHRGASGYLPEHTKEAATMAFMQGADYIEQDLVLSKDNHLVVLHDIHIERVTNVEEIFPQRAREDGRFYAIDFTLAELRQLSVHERHNKKQKMVFKGRYQGSAHFTVATFEEHIELINNLNRQFNQHVGIYPEIKAPEWHAKEGKDIVFEVSRALKAHDLNHANAKVFVQSFEPNSLIRLKTELGIKTPLIQLIADDSWNESSTSYAEMLTPNGLAKIASYANGIGPWLNQIIKNDTFSDVITNAKKHALLVHPFTFRTDVIGSEAKSKALFEALKKNGIDGLFTDQIMPYMVGEN